MRTTLKRPKGTTHAKILTTDRKKSIVDIKHMDCFRGVEGKVTYLKKQKDKYVELGAFDFDGNWPLKDND
jgi:hypothetical protein